MTLAILLWAVVSFGLALLVGKFIAFGMGSHPSNHSGDDHE